jgi:hypothetical protein
VPTLDLEQASLGSGQELFGEQGGELGADHRLPRFLERGANALGERALGALGSGTEPGERNP